jgi:uncharacterized protein YbaR (Trm112 family)
MQLELQCPRCERHFAIEHDTPAGAALDRIAEEDPWVGLGDGGTMEDSLYAALTAEGAIHCPECGANVPVSEEQLSELAREVLARW